ncbi:hypothetical protein HD554DRAFT_2027126 [Boletus coccyginus]|nr:hypothetical protein HD554DRAFT_2027126 [Boletus coccyginus]
MNSIQAFHFGWTTNLLPPSIVHNKSENNEDWDCVSNYNYSSFVDRDIFMRYRGGGVGHKLTYEATHYLLNDHKTLNKQSFVLKNDHNLFKEAVEESGEDVSMDDSSSAEEESDEEPESNEDGSEMESIEAKDIE